MFFNFNFLALSINNSYLLSLAIACKFFFGLTPLHVKISRLIEKFFKLFLTNLASEVEFSLNLWSTIKYFTLKDFFIEYILLL